MLYEFNLNYDNNYFFDLWTLKNLLENNQFQLIGHFKEPATLS